MTPDLRPAESKATRRIWFKPDCVGWIRDGKKITTFRKNRHIGTYEVVTGSRYKAKKTGLIIKLIPIETRPSHVITSADFHTEGPFDGPTEFVLWLKGVKLELPPVGWIHRIEVVEDC